MGLFTGDASYGTLPGQRPSQLGNPDLGWESTQQIDLGLDFGILKTESMERLIITPRIPQVFC